MAKKKAKKKPAKKKTTKKKTSTGKATKSAASSDMQSRLQALLEKPGTSKKVLAMLKPLNEKQRQELAPFCDKWLRKTGKDQYLTTKNGFKLNPLMESAEIAAFCVCGITAIKKNGRWWLPDDKIVLEVMKQRKPKWAPELVELLLNSTYFWNSWRLVRELIRAKLCPKPDNPRYYSGMISGLCAYRFEKKRRTLTAALKDDPDLLKDEVWRLFELEGEAENTLANADRFENTNWLGTLVKYCRDGKLSRPRLLDCSLSALELGFNHYRSKWFMDFFDQLKPDKKELKKHSDTILNLTSSPTPNITKWAFQWLQKLFKDGIVTDCNAITNALEPLMQVRQKGSVLAALKMLASVLKDNPQNVSQICSLAAVGLSHEKADVQKAALKFVTTNAPPDDSELRKSVEDSLPLVSASVRKQVKAWLNAEEANAKPKPNEPKSKAAKSKVAPSSSNTKKSAAKFDRKRISGFPKQHLELVALNQLVESFDSVADGPFVIPATSFDGTEFPRLDSDRALTPISDIEELLEVCGRAIENDLIDDGERALEGIARLGQKKPGDFETLAGPLLKRAKQNAPRESWPFSGLSLKADLCGIIICWINDSKVTTRQFKNEYNMSRLEVTGVLDEPYDCWYEEGLPLAFFSARSLEICQRIEKGAFILLSAPTHQGGWIDPRTFVKRINKLDKPPGDTDLIQALLRLAPEHREKARKSLKPKLKGEWVNVARYGLGDSVSRLGKSAALWAAAARCRTPFDDDEKVIKAFPKLGPGAGEAAKYIVDLKTDDFVTTQGKGKQANALLPTQLLQRNNCHSSISFHDLGTTAGSINWLATLRPIAFESFFAGGATCLYSNLDWWEAAWHNRNFMEPLLDSDVPPLEVGMFMLFCGLAAKEPGEHGLAVDVTIQAINDGRIGTDNLGRTFSKYAHEPNFNLTRLSKRFADIATASQLHAAVSFQAWADALTSMPAKRRGLGDIVEFLIETGTELGCGVVCEETRKHLESFKGSGKAAKAARLLLTLPHEFDATDCLHQAIEGRLERLAIWKSRK